MSERVLLHVCCGPCGVFPVESLRAEGFEVTGFFHNPNIQPFQEYLKRRDAVQEMAAALALGMLWKDEYRLKEWLRETAFREEFRCELCYRSRLTEAAARARKEKFDWFSSSIFYSKHQKHELAKEVAECVAKEQGVRFLYRDFRSGWKNGIERSVQLGLYRQQYCGCIYSEYERYAKADKSKQEAAG
jgi:epoxyqueuosine reductase